MTSNRSATIALNRFGLGGGGGEVPRDPLAWLLDQLSPPPLVAAMRGLPDTPEYQRQFRDWQQRRQQARKMDDGDAVENFRQAFQSSVYAEVNALAEQQVRGEAPFAERLVMFWSNHFAVSTDKLQMALLPGAYQREAIRPHVSGPFGDLLIAAVQHPAMLIYLDNWRSIGPNSRAGRNPPKRLQTLLGGEAAQIGLNENLAREILELHSLGVDGGYTQDDVIELARGISGWTLAGRRRGNAVGYRFERHAHEPGTRRLLGKTYAEDGEAQGLAMLHDLARHPATSRFVTRKLARHFVADEPPPALLARLQRAWSGSGGRLDAVYRALIEAPESWAPEPRKFKRPDEFLVSAMRATGLPPAARAPAWAAALATLGQPPFKPGSPAGWPDEAAGWIAPNGLLKRFEIAEQLASQLPGRIEPLALAERALGSGLGAGTRQALSRAESPQQAVALLLCCPEFQWR